MRRTTITVSDDLDELLRETAGLGLMRRVLVEWLLLRGESDLVLKSEGGRIRVLLQVAEEALRDRVMDIGYQSMGAMVDESIGNHAARDRVIEREAPRWRAEEAPAGSPR